MKIITFPLKFTEDRHKDIKIAATMEGVSIKEFIETAISDKIKKTKLPFEQ